MILVISILCSFIFGIVAFIASNNLVVGICVLIISLLYFLIFLIPRFKKYNAKIDRFHECFEFINNFVITLSIKNSLVNSLESSMNLCGDELKKDYENIGSIPTEEKIFYLKRHFNFNLYSIFCDVLKVWIDQGGNIIEMSNNLISIGKDSEEYIIYTNSINKKILSEFSILWTLSMSILLMLRFALKDYYSLFSKQLFFPISIGIYFVIVLFSIEVITRKMTSIDLKGCEYEK